MLTLPWGHNMKCLFWVHSVNCFVQFKKETHWLWKIFLVKFYIKRMMGNYIWTLQSQLNGLNGHRWRKIIMQAGHVVMMVSDVLVPYKCQAISCIYIETRPFSDMVLFIAARARLLIWVCGVCSLTYCNGNFRFTRVSELLIVIL